MRFVCPSYEVERAAHAAAAGLAVHESWWLLELPGPGGGVAGVPVDLRGSPAMTVGAPPVYAPPGPILFLPARTDAVVALPAAFAEAPGLGCAAVVVNQAAGDEDLAVLLGGAGFRRHCDYYEGTVRAL